jgi:hypothetical protein
MMQGDSFYVLIEQGDANDPDKMRRSPAMQTMAKVTGLMGGSSD